MAERHAVKRIGLAFKATDGPSQSRKRTHARAGHAPLLEFGPAILRNDRSFVHDMF
jgi:hypothetical protein